MSDEAPKRPPVDVRHVGLKAIATRMGIGRNQVIRLHRDEALPLVSLALPGIRRPHSRFAWILYESMLQRWLYAKARSDRDRRWGNDRTRDRETKPPPA